MEGEQERGTMKEDVKEGQEGDRADQRTTLPLVPPSNLLSIPERDRQHIFNPCPGVVHHLSPLPHSEITVDHTLLPLPLHPSSCMHTHPTLHPQDIIPGVMQWKQFPCHWLAATEALRRTQPPLQSHTRRMTDLFMDGLLAEIPSELHLLSGPQPDDIIDDTSSSEVLPTPTLEMVRAQFFMPEGHVGSTQEDNRSTECQTAMEQPPATAGDGLRVRLQQRLENVMTLFNTTGTRKS
jgi:hypothetical protein